MGCHDHHRQERDQYDELQPTYLVAVTQAGSVAGCVRLLPAHGPTMLKRTFPQLLESGALPVRPAVIESSRFCVDTSLAAGREGKGVSCTLRRSPCSAE